MILPRMAPLKPTVRHVLAVGAALAFLFLFLDWRHQLNAPLSCQGNFGDLEEHNGYVQFDILGPHTTERYFEAKVFFYYPAAQGPSSPVRLTRTGDGGTYAPSVRVVDLGPFSNGLAPREPVSIDLPTPNSSQKNFPFDSADLVFTLSIDPPIQPKMVRVRNRTTNFIPLCDTFSSQWNPSGELKVAVRYQRNPFVRTVVVILGLAALGFGLLLGRIEETEDLAVATASYFFSLWSVRAIVAPNGLPYPTLLDLWLMSVSIIVLFIVAWRLAAPRTSKGNGRPAKPV